MKIKEKMTLPPFTQNTLESEKIGHIGGINRTNTGGLVTAIGRAPTKIPVTRHIQAIKAIARRLVLERLNMSPSTPLTFLKKDIEIGLGIQLLKTTIGPDVNNPGEWMESMQLLLEAGVPAEKMFFIPTFRDPMDTAASWKRMWGWDMQNFPFDSFNFSFKKIAEMIIQAKKADVLVIPYIHEFLRDFGATKTLVKIFEKANIPFDESVVNWEDDNDPYWQGQIVKYDQPPDDWIAGTLSKKKGGRGGLVWKEPNPENKFSESERVIVRNKIEPAIKIYRSMRVISLKQLGFKS